MANAENVASGKPLVGGAIYRGPLEVELPNSVEDTLAGFASLGFISSDGVTNSPAISTEKVTAWGGATVDENETEHNDTWEFTMLETLLEEVQKTVYGDSNVTGDLDSGRRVDVTTDEQEYKAWVVDTILKKKFKKRIVIPKAKVTEIGDMVYVDNQPLGYKVKLSAVPYDETGTKTHYELIKRAAVV